MLCLVGNGASIELGKNNRLILSKSELSDPAAFFTGGVFRRRVFGLKFQAGFSGAFKYHLARQTAGFKAESFATARSVLVPGDEEMLAFEAVD